MIRELEMQEEMAILGGDPAAYDAGNNGGGGVFTPIWQNPNPTLPIPALNHPGITTPIYPNPTWFEPPPPPKRVCGEGWTLHPWGFCTP